MQHLYLPDRSHAAFESANNCQGRTIASFQIEIDFLLNGMLKRSRIYLILGTVALENVSLGCLGIKERFNTVFWKWISLWKYLLNSRLSAGLLNAVDTTHFVNFMVWKQFFHKMLKHPNSGVIGKASLEVKWRIWSKTQPLFVLNHLRQNLDLWIGYFYFGLCYTI